MPEPTPNKQPVDVDIMGVKYSIRSGYDKDFVHRTAELVNQRMGELVKGSGVVSTDKVAILACLNIASDYLKLQEDTAHLRNEMAEKCESILHVVESCLNEQASAGEMNDLKPLPCS